ncbi:hypothetical protein [Fibrisoma montanum]|nr:hypothetical protein [Fibrisoma montanum]
MQTIRNQIDIRDMAQARYILNFKGTPPFPLDDLRLIRDASQVLDSGRKTLLIEVEEDTAYELARKLPDWTVKKETRYAIPSTRPQVKRPPR